MIRSTWLCLSLLFFAVSFGCNRGEIFESYRVHRSAGDVALSYCEGSRGGMFPFMNPERVSGELNFIDYFTAHWIGSNLRSEYGDIFRYAQLQGYDARMAESVECEPVDKVVMGSGCTLYSFVQRYPRTDSGVVETDEILFGVSVCGEEESYYVRADLGRNFREASRSRMALSVEELLKGYYWERAGGVISILCGEMLDESVSGLCDEWADFLSRVRTGSVLDEYLDYEFLELRALHRGYGGMFDSARFRVRAKGEATLSMIVFEERGSRCLLGEDAESAGAGNPLIAVPASGWVDGYCVLPFVGGLRSDYRPVGVIISETVQ